MQRKYFKIAKDLVEGLEPSYVTTKLFQKEQLPLTDAYGYWLKCKANTQNIKSPFSRKLFNNLNSRESQMFDNVVVYAALFLDPRYQFILNNEKKKQAKSYIKITAKRLEDHMKPTQGGISD